MGVGGNPPRSVAGVAHNLILEASAIAVVTMENNGMTRSRSPDQGDLYEDEVPAVGLDCEELALIRRSEVYDPNPGTGGGGDGATGGALVEFVEPDPTPFNIVSQKKNDDVRALLAYSLFGLLAGTVAIVIAGLWTAKFDRDTAEWVTTSFVGPELALLGAATAFYYSAR